MSKQRSAGIHHEFKVWHNPRRVVHSGTWVDGEKVDPSRLIIDLLRYRVIVLDKSAGPCQGELFD